jgi:hypothetical protein
MWSIPREVTEEERRASRARLVQQAPRVTRYPAPVAAGDDDEIAGAPVARVVVPAQASSSRSSRVISSPQIQASAQPVATERRVIIRRTVKPFRLFGNDDDDDD